MNTRILRFLSGGLAALGLATGALAFDYIRNNSTGLPIKWPAGNVGLRIMLGTTPTLIDGSNYNTSAQDAANTWNALLGSIVFQTSFATGTATDGRPSGGSRANEVVFSGTIFGQDFGDKTLAVTTTWRSGNNRIESDILFNSARTWDSYAGPTRSNSSGTVYDLHRVALHELGHSLGLDHPDEASPPQNVGAIMNSRISNLDTLTMDDITGAQNLYGPPGAPPNNNFASATVIGNLNTSGGITVTGYNTLSTKEPLEPNHGGNSGGRSVWWKWTAPGNGSVTLDTRGSYYDTILAVYTGTGVSALSAIASNDDINPGVVQASSLNFNASSGTVYYFGVDGFNADTGGIILNLAFAPTGGTTPVITAQPISIDAVAGADATFSVTATASGSALSYQWRYNGSPISGETSSTLTVHTVTPSFAGTYTVVVSTSSGSVTSNPATLTVTAGTAPTIVVQPVGQSAATGSTVTLVVTAKGTPTPTIVWFFNTAVFPGLASVNPDPAAGTVTSSIELSSLSSANGGQYFATATNPVGSVASTTVTLTVTAPAPAPTPTPTPTPSSGGGGGGGAPSFWFLLILAVVAATRWTQDRTWDRNT